MFPPPDFESGASTNSATGAWAGDHSQGPPRVNTPRLSTVRGPRGGLLKQLEDVRVVRCDEAPWRLLGLSLAGYNVLISLALAGMAGWGVALTRGRTRSPDGA